MTTLEFIARKAVRQAKQDPTGEPATCPYKKPAYRSVWFEAYDNERLRQGQEAEAKRREEQMKATLQIGQRVRDGLGHWYDVLEIAAGGFRIRVQPLTPVGSPATLQPLGGPAWGFRSSFRADGE